MGSRETLLGELATIRGVYVPQLRPPGSAFRVQRQWVSDLDGCPVHTEVFTRDTEFGEHHLIEIARGCGHGCRFCLAGCLYRPHRERGVSIILEQARAGKQYRNKVGLVSAAVSDYSQLDELLAGLRELNLQVAVSSLRVEPLPEQLLSVLAASGTRTLTMAPEAGSERLRGAIRKGIQRSDILSAADTASRHFRELKLYFMVGLPDEQDEDILAIVELVEAIGRAFRGRIATSVAPFVPKAHTAFEREPMAQGPVLEQRLRHLRKALAQLGVRLHAESVPWSRVQATLARGDRRLGKALACLREPTLAGWSEALAANDLHPEAYIAARTTDEQLPWAFIHL